MKAKDIFKVGENKIGYVDSSFTKEFGEEEITGGSVLKFQKLPRDMKDSEIISELKIEECTLGDVLQTLNNGLEEMKDGYYNIFYIKGHSRVVGVGWRGDEWDVGGWSRDGRRWHGGARVFSPATSDSGMVGPKSSETLSLYCECAKCPKCGKLIK